jgi:uncharacterized protein YyaL (SSP411 family)
MALEGKRAGAVHHSGINWVGWSPDVFVRARREHKLVILDLEAVWCHWCHVMDERTYADANVSRAINANYIAVRVDQDSRPDLSNKYQNYGWPATIIFATDGTELAKRAGFIEPEDMAHLLSALARTRKPEESSAVRHVSYSQDHQLSSALRAQLTANHIKGYDTVNGAWSTGQKFMDADSEEYALTMAKQGDSREKQMADQTLMSQLHLVDPIWGGVCQYSTHNDWNHAHFEKIMSIQSDNLRMYSLGYLVLAQERYLRTAKLIFGYLENFLRSPDGAFYCSQDADLVPGKHSDEYYKLSDGQRRKQGIPRIDKHLYARENGWAISGLTALYAASGDPQVLKAAQEAANWVVAHRALPGGGYAHDEHDAAGPYLGDTLYMGRAFLDLYGVTGDKRWLNLAKSAADFAIDHFAVKKGRPGLLTCEARTDAVVQSDPLLDENVAGARFFNLLNCYAPNEAYKQQSRSCMQYLATPEIANQRKIFVGGILLADRELSRPPVHITAVGSKQDPQAAQLFLAALRYPTSYKQTEWYDKGEGPLASGEVEFPDLPNAAVFGCAFGRCSLPIFEASKIAGTIDSFASSQN